MKVKGDPAVDYLPAANPPAERSRPLRMTPGSSRGISESDYLKGGGSFVHPSSDRVALIRAATVVAWSCSSIEIHLSWSCLRPQRSLEP